MSAREKALEREQSEPPPKGDGSEVAEPRITSAGEREMNAKLAARVDELQRRADAVKSETGGEPGGWEITEADLTAAAKACEDAPAVPDFFLVVAETIRDRLKARIRTEPEGAPVAWRSRITTPSGPGGWAFHHGPEVPVVFTPDSVGYGVETVPLYIHPPKETP